MDHLPDDARLRARPPDGAPRLRPSSSTTASPPCAAGSTTTLNGGWFAQVGADGPTVTDKTAYEHAFVVLAGASATAAGRPGGRELLDDAVAVLLEHFWDDEFGMVVEQWDRGVVRRSTATAA